MYIHMCTYIHRFFIIDEIHNKSFCLHDSGDSNMQSGFCDRKLPRILFECIRIYIYIYIHIYMYFRNPIFILIFDVNIELHMQYKSIIINL